MSLLKSFYGPILTDQQYECYFKDFLDMLTLTEPVMGLSTLSILDTLLLTPLSDIKCVKNKCLSNEGWVIVNQGGFSIRPYFETSIDHLEHFLNTHPNVKGVYDFETFVKVNKFEKGHVLVTIFKYSDALFLFVINEKHKHSLITCTTSDLFTDTLVLLADSKTTSDGVFQDHSQILRVDRQF